jgi:iron complex transport system permease protein
MAWRILLALALVAVSFGLATWVGSTGLLHELGPDAWTLWWDIRVPRVATGAAVGSLLALSGAAMQSVLRNPLADPYLLGTASGAGLGAVIALALNLPSPGVELAALIGAVLAIVLVGALAGSKRGFDEQRVVLVGVATGALLGAATNVVLAVAEDGQLRGMLFWLLGDLGGIEGARLIVLLGAAFLALLWACADARAIDAIAWGDAIARDLGVDARIARLRTVALAAFGTAIAVSNVGAIGFVGFAAPHIARRLFGADARIALPAAAAVGASAVMLADAAARTVVAPQLLPVGVFTALIGVPVLLHQLLRGRR